MSEFIDTLSPPFEIKLYDGSPIRFRRMLAKHWAALTVQIRSERTAQNDAEINADAGKKDAPPYNERALAREKIRDFIRRTSDIDSLVQYCRSDIDGIATLLKYAAMDCGTTAEQWEQVKDTISMPNQTRIADEIVFVPIPPPKAAPQSQSDGGESSNPANKDSTGETASTTAESADATPTK